MGNFRIYQDDHADFTVLSNRFIDEYMEDANDAQLKVYLYLMRMLNADLATGISDIADRFNFTEREVIRSLKYWEQKGILKLDLTPAGNPVGVHMLSLTPDRNSDVMTAEDPSYDETPAIVPTAGTDNIAPIREEAVTEVVTDIRDFAKPRYTRDDLSKFASHGSQLIFVAEQYMHKTLTQADLSTLLFISDTLHFSDDLTDFLLQYCVGKGKAGHRYIETVAMDWAQSGITTPEEAAIYVSRYDSAYEILRALGKNNTDPSTVELELINKWTTVFGYDMDVIKEACARTVLATDRNRFKYADSILTKWNALGIRNVADIDKLDTVKKKPSSPSGNQGKNTFKTFPQNTYDYSELEKNIISN